MISEDKIQEIIDKTDIVSLVSEYVQLTKKGSGYFGLCPFHDDSSPSFSVSPDKKIAKCMSCKAGGNPITFLKQIKNISFMEAATELAVKANVHLDIKKAQTIDKNQKYYDIFQVAQDFYTYNLFNTAEGSVALQYLYDRGLTDEVIKSFKIGLATKNNNALTNVLFDKGFVDLDCLDLSLIKNNDGVYTDFFINRIMFPITNERGKIIAYSARLFDSSQGPKYVNSPETVIYRKGDHLYNLSNAISQINKTKRIIICEGQMDAIKISTSGLSDVVCPLGSSLTQNQVKLIRKYAKNVVFIFDSDNAGINATLSSIKLLNDLNPKVVNLPNGLDPDEFIKKYGNEDFIELVENAVDSIEFTYKSFFINKDISNITDSEQIKKDIFNYLRTLKSPLIEERILNKTALDLEINKDTIFNDYYSNNKVNYNENKKLKNDYQQNNNYIENSYLERMVPPEPTPRDYDNYYNNNYPNSYNDYNHNDNNLTNNIDTNKLANNGFIDSLKTFLTVILIDRDSISVIREIFDVDELESCLPDDYLDFYLSMIDKFNTISYNIEIEEVLGLIIDECSNCKEIIAELNKLVHRLINTKNLTNIYRSSLYTIKIEYLKTKQNELMKEVNQQSGKNTKLMSEIFNIRAIIDTLEMKRKEYN